MAVGPYLIIDGKTRSEHWLKHLLLGGVAGLFLGLFFSRNVKSDQSPGGEKLT